MLVLESQTVFCLPQWGRTSYKCWFFKCVHKRKRGGGKCNGIFCGKDILGGKGTIIIKRLYLGSPFLQNSTTVFCFGPWVAITLLKIQWRHYANKRIIFCFIFKTKCLPNAVYVLYVGSIHVVGRRLALLGFWSIKVSEVDLHCFHALFEDDQSKINSWQFKVQSEVVESVHIL